MDVVIIKMLMSALLCFLRTRVTETCPEKLVHSVETTNHFIAHQTIACCMETLRVEQGGKMFVFEGRTVHVVSCAFGARKFFKKPRPFYLALALLSL